MIERLRRQVISDEVAERLERLQVPFNRYGLDPYGVSRHYLGPFYTLLELFYRRYFRVQSAGIEQVPNEGPLLLVANHSGGLPIDAGMLLAALFFDHEPPRLAHGMVEYFAQTWPFVSKWFARVGQLAGLPEHARLLLRDGRPVMVFPEGARGTGKLYKDRYQLVRFGSGFMRLALQTGAPIVPVAFVGGEEAIPTVLHLNRLAKLVGAPYFPVTPYLLPLPRPVLCNLAFGEPMRFEGDGNESDELVHRYVEDVKQRVVVLLEEGRAARRLRLGRPDPRVEAFDPVAPVASSHKRGAQ